MHWIMKKKMEETMGQIACARHIFLKDGSKGGIFYMPFPLTLMTGLQLITKEIYTYSLKNKLTLVRCKVPKGEKDGKKGKKPKKNRVDFDCVLQIKTFMVTCPPHVVSLNLNKA